MLLHSALTASTGSVFVEAFLDSLTDGLKMLPVLYLAYLLMELLEHHAGSKVDRILSGVGKAGPLIGAALGAIPQCGFSGAAAGLYSGGIITMGTLISVFISTSDEMLPVLLSGGAGTLVIAKLVLGKVACGILFGYLVDLIFRGHTHAHIEDLCRQDHCECEHENIFLSALKHTGKTMLVIFIVSLALNLVFDLGGAHLLQRLMLNVPVVSELITALLGLIPSCAVSVALSQLYLTKGIISTGALVSGLASNAGVGLLVLFRQNHNKKDNLRIIAVLYITGVLSGILLRAVLG
ncbi:MAG TPA: hypothetical protein DEP00_04510 [Lachnospiraceae bacterium]|nr:hypothetical protein [Lachnospiraceae bacterium]